ncbi:uncharacterized protein LOC116304101 [Actinia tenebrosa]|uniref:Uncharacterized protein LOC116304101 n=1 Tax=Actinia tenebrosa TaxID=6105 RepID=A0A6P8ITS2_ACTTE|nr:uncharacterized protein LOC116304101 [Actinia tenebrosa]
MPQEIGKTKDISLTMGSTGRAKIYRDTIQSRIEPKHHVKTITPIDWNLQMYTRPSVICKLSTSCNGVGSNMIPRPSSSSTPLHQEFNHGRSSKAFPLNSQEENFSLIPASKKKYEDTIGHLSLRRKRSISEDCLDESHQVQDESTAHKQEDRVSKTVQLHCPWHYRKRTIIQANPGEPHPDDSTAAKQGNKYATAHPTWSYGKRYKRQAILAKPHQREEETTPFEDIARHDILWLQGKKDCPGEIVDDNTTFKEEGYDRNNRGHLLWMHGRRRIKQDCPGEPCKIVYGGTTSKEEDGNYKTQDFPLCKEDLGVTHQKDDLSLVFKEESEDTTGYAQWFNRKKTINKEASLGKPYANKGEDESKYKDGNKKGHLSWLYGNGTIKQIRIVESHHREVERSALKEQDKEATVHFPWLNGKRTIKQARLGESHQSAKSISFREENANERCHQEQLPNDKFTNPSEYEGTNNLHVSRQSRKEDNRSPPRACDFIQQHDVVGWSNMARGITRTTCPVCYKKLSRFNNLKSHMLIHTGDKPYKCAYCSKAFNQIGNRNAHQRIHTGEKPYACDYCGKRFSFSSSKHNHMKIHWSARNSKITENA